MIPNRGVLYLADGSTQKIYTIAPGPNGKFDGVASTGGDDIVTSFSAQSLGTPSDESIAYDPVHDILYIIQSRELGGDGNTHRAIAGHARYLCG